jgi:hypothetical protein
VNEAKSDLAVSYDEFKEHEGQRYTGMRIGRSHKWSYDQGEWKEKKITPDLWQIGYAVTKRRAGRAPEGSGVPVGTEYHWYILAHQNTAKQTANDYTTSSPVSSSRSRTSARAVRSGVLCRGPTQAHDHVPAKCPRRTREAERPRGRSDRRAGDAGRTYAHSSDVAGRHKACKRTAGRHTRVCARFCEWRHSRAPCSTFASDYGRMKCDRRASEPKQPFGAPGTGHGGLYKTGA